MVGEIGGDAEERAAEYIAESVSKPVVAYIAGFTAPPGKQMGHAGAIISGSSGTAEAKKEALEAKGVRVGKSPTETAAARGRGAACGRLGAALSRVRVGGTSARAAARRAPAGRRSRVPSSSSPSLAPGVAAISDPAARSQRLRPRS